MHEDNIPIGFYNYLIKICFLYLIYDLFEYLFSNKTHKK